ncbi:UDP-N-acetylglucosamine transferase subunit ALG14 [Neoconidiobolus thromboides FSU 785]|nr:UDP-N-acetylglucosamine transferase subunit ALG14 [Neoconidiobolus thromboides FSU 785]
MKIILIILLIIIVLITIILYFLKNNVPIPSLIKNSSKTETTQNSIKTLCFLGSGGHTAEMIELLKSLQISNYTPRTYLIGEGDSLSLSKIIDFENETQVEYSKYKLYTIPRARQVGQSWITTPFSTFKTLVSCFSILIYEKPEYIFGNGPGSCVPLFLLAKFISTIHPKSRLKLVYIESFARVNTLSLSGKILYYFTDLFIVQWPNLLKKYPKAKYNGVLV